MGRFGRWAVLSALILVASAVSAQTPPPKGPQKWAVVIGIGKYKDPQIRPLPYAAADAQAIHQFLISPNGGGYPAANVTLLTDERATNVAVRSALGRGLANRAIKGDKVFIYYAGHGAPEYDPDETDGYAKYLVPHDSDADDLYSTAINMTEIGKVFARVRADTIVLALDTCYSGAGGGRGFSMLPQGQRSAPLTANFLERIARGQGRAILAAADTNEVALEVPQLRHGLFTFYLLEALLGKADSASKGYVTLSDTYQYVHERVARHSRQLRGNQNPKLMANQVGEIVLAGRHVETPTPPKLVIRDVLVGSLVISSTIEGVDVFLDDERIETTRAGKAIAIDNLAAGMHRLRASKPGFRDWQREVSIVPNQRTDAVVALETATALTPAATSPSAVMEPTPSLQPEPPKVIAAPVPAPSPSSKGERYAVVIGVGAYDNPTIPRLRFAENDARAMYDFLTTKGGYRKDNVLLVTDTTQQKPTLANIKRALGHWLYKRAGKDDSVLVYYAGHGAPEGDASGVDRDGLSKYLIPRDADPQSLFVTAFSTDDIETIISRLHSERVVFMLDICYRGSGGLSQSKGRVVLSACGSNEGRCELPEFRHSLFTYYLLKGMEGEADQNKDGIVTVTELYDYVRQKVSETAQRLARKQTPMMSEAVVDFPLIQVGTR